MHGAKIAQLIRSQCDARGDFLSTQGKPRQREVGNVQSTDEKDKKCAARQQIKSSFDTSSQHVLGV